MVARIEQNKLLDGVSLYMTFRQFGASLGVALLTVLIDRRETLHSGAAFPALARLQGGNTAPGNRLARAADIGTVRGGLSPHDAMPAATALLREVSTRQSETLANADAFLFMACVGVIALCLVPLIPPTPPAKK